MKRGQEKERRRPCDVVLVAPSLIRTPRYRRAHGCGIAASARTVLTSGANAACRKDRSCSVF